LASDATQINTLIDDYLSSSKAAYRAHQLTT